MLDFRMAPRDGGSDPIPLTADASDVYFWEKAHPGKTMTELVRDKHMVDLYQVAHLAAQRLGIFTDDNVDEFARTYTLMLTKERDVDGEVDPTRTAP